MREKINKDNYEAFFLDFIEGNLSDDQTSILFSFLDKNPDLKAELDAFEAIELDHESLSPNESLKASLRREETTALLETDYLMIAQVENTITSEEKAKLAVLAKQHPEILDDLAIYHKTRIPKEPAIVFSNKTSLTKKERILPIWWQSAAAAAVLMLLFFNWPSVEKRYDPNDVFSFRSNTANLNEINYAFTVIENSPRMAEKENVSIVANTEKTILPKKETIAQPQKNDLQHEEKAFAQLAEKSVPVKENMNSPITPVDTLTNPSNDESLAELAEIVQSENKLASQAAENYTPIDEFVKKKIKKDVLKGKTVSETILEELSELAKEKINLETNKGESQKLALNIGKFSFSRSR